MTTTEDDVFEEYEEGEPGTELAVPEDDEVEGEVVETKGQLIKSDIISTQLDELKEAAAEGEPIKPKKGMTKAKATALNEEITDACTKFGDRFDDWVTAGEKVVTLVEQGLEYRAFAALKMEPVEWIKSVVTFPMIAPEARKLLTKVLFRLGLPQRTIAEITGSSKGTVSRDLAGAPSGAGETVKGADGKEYPKRQEPDEDEAETDEEVEADEDEGDEVEEPENVLSAAKETAEALTEWTDELLRLSESQKFTKSAKTIHKRYVDALNVAYENLGAVIDKLTSAAEEL